LKLWEEGEGRVYFDGATWVATICNGWWMAIGQTKKAAIHAVIERYNREVEENQKRKTQ
jgi:type II secretory pathway predicted ATPase ExeA